MKVVAFNGSARREGNTAALIKAVFTELEREGIATELVPLAGHKMSGCIACYKCFENKDKRCNVKDDFMNDCIAKMVEADGIILGSPTYFADMSAATKALIERAGMVGRANDFMFKRKVGAPVVAVRRAGATSVISAINYFFLAEQMVIPGSSYWNLAIGRNPGEVLSDQEGMRTMEDLGRNMAWLMKKVNS